jgi:hypothetical protein
MKAIQLIFSGILYNNQLEVGVNRRKINMDENVELLSINS